MKRHLLKFICTVLLLTGFMGLAPMESYADVALINGGGFRVTIATNRSSDPSAGTWSSYSLGSTWLLVYDPGYSGSCNYLRNVTAVFFPEPQWGSGALVEGTVGMVVSSVWQSGAGGTYRYYRGWMNSSLTGVGCQTWTTGFLLGVGPDAYDHAYALWIDVDGSGEVQFTGNGPAILEDAGRELIVGPQTIGGIDVTRKIYVPQSEPWIRHLVILNNPSGSVHNIDVLIQSNLGSDGRGRTSGSVTENFSSDGNPHVFRVIDGPSGGDVMDAGVRRFGFGDGDNWRWNSISLNPGETKVFQFFVGGTTNVSTASSVVNAINTEPPSLNVGMSTLELDSVQNWNSPNTLLGGPSVYDLAPVQITFPNITAEGTTTVTPVLTPVPPKGFRLGTPELWYDISTTATFTPPVEVCITYDEAAFSQPEDSLVLFHFDDLGVGTDITTSLDTAADVICGEVTSFSEFAVLEPKPKKQPNPVVESGSSGSCVAARGSANNGAFAGLILLLGFAVLRRQ